MSRVVIRADGGNQIGMGHIIRTLALANVLISYVEVIYACNEKYIEGIQYLIKNKFRVITLKEDSLLEDLVTIEADLLITDNYEIDSRYIEKVRRKFKYVMYIDDEGIRKYDTDILLNQNLGAENINYLVNKDAMKLLGSQFILLRDEFRSIQPSQYESCVVKTRILLTIGGSDYYNWTEKILKNIKDLPYEFNVVIGPIFPYENQLRRDFKEYTNIYFHKTPCMSRLMQKCQIAISACGSSLYELGILGVPTIGIVLADNQEKIALNMEKYELIKYVGDIRKCELKAIKQELENLISDKTSQQNLISNNRKYVNINGVYQVRDVILKLLKEGGKDVSNSRW